MRAFSMLRQFALLFGVVILSALSGCTQYKCNCQCQKNDGSDQNDYAIVECTVAPLAAAASQADLNDRCAQAFGPGYVGVPNSCNCSATPHDCNGREIRVLVLNFDPFVQPGVRLHSYGNWTDPRTLANGYAEEVYEASAGYIRYTIVEWQDLDEFPVKADGYVYTKEEYLADHQNGMGWHEPELADYPQVIAQYNITARIQSGEIDEVWWFGGPYFGFYESAMAGKGAFFINGGVYGEDQVPCDTAFAIMGFNYERGVAEMLHDLSHRTESTMSRIFGGWQVDQLDTDWARFAANDVQSGGVAAVGTCHYPPNAESDYDYANPRTVQSSADDWLNYPNLTGEKKPVNCETWGGPDYHRNYLRWWFSHLPRAAGVNAENDRLNNWWEYVFFFNDYDEHGAPVF